MFGFLTKKVQQIDVTDVKSALENKKEIILLDVRTPEEFKKGSIKGSINLPMDKIETEIEKLIPNKEKTIYVYCLSGSRSDHAVDMMVKIGYNKTYSMKSGLLAWRANRYSTS